MNLLIAKTKFADTKYSRLYFLLCEKLDGKSGGITHKHHFLPKSMFPEYSDLKANTWNCISVSPRVHHLLHFTLYMHFKVISDSVNATSNIRACSNFTKNSKKYQSFRERLSNSLRAKWRNEDWSESTKRRMSEAAKLRYQSEDSRRITSEAAIRWNSEIEEPRRQEINSKISNTLKTKHEFGEISAKQNYERWKSNDPDSVASMNLAIKTTINSEEYKATRWKSCEFCNESSSPGNYAQYHGEYCALNPNKKIKEKKTCGSCGKSFANFKQHLRHKTECKEFYGK